ncbi:hypothetical protein JCM8547_008010 [Rhodosporidiobolus lusitaniae]
MLAPVVAAATFASFALAQSTLTAAPSASQVAKAVKRAESSALPLTEYTYSYGSQPYQVNPYASGRGPQSGYNQCNLTTAGPDSECQTLIANNASDFCLWGSPTTTANGTIGDVEAAVVAYCTNDKFGARVIPEGAITGLQVMHTSAYIQWTGHINMTALNLASDDTGGELDPHGADLAGNPLGGLVYSTGLPTGDNVTEIQAINWNNFIGSGVFCLKLCDNTITSPDYCQNKYDLIGCTYNMPAAYEDGVFLECDGDLQDEVGTYTDSTGATQTWSQPESLAADTTLPWTPRIPASSNCVTYQSSDLFPTSLLGYQNTASASATATASSGATTSTGSAASSRSGASSGSAAATGTNSAAAASSSSSTTSGASSLVLSSGVFAVVLGTVAALA